MAWPTPLWSITGSDTAYIYVNSDTYWQRDSNDAELHVLGSNETTVHEVGMESDRRIWRGLVRDKAMLKKLRGLVKKNCSFSGPYDSGSCRVMNVKPQQVPNVSDINVGYYRVTVELMHR